MGRPANRIPRHRGGEPDPARLTADERRVLGALYRAGRPAAVAQLARATGLGEARVRRALARLAAPWRGHQLGLDGAPLVPSATGPGLVEPSPEWIAARRTPPFQSRAGAGVVDPGPRSDPPKPAARRLATLRAARPERP